MPRPFLQRDKMNSFQEPPASPCVRCCCLDRNNLCLGCFRTLDEITGWTRMTPDERLAVLSRTEKRRQQQDRSGQ
jgi:predicted Fe-S protein YdhL (DUF1289 family)